MVASENVGGQIWTGDIADMDQGIGVRPGDRNQDIAWHGFPPLVFYAYCSAKINGYGFIKWIWSALYLQSIEKGCPELDSLFEFIVKILCDQKETLFSNVQKQICGLFPNMGMILIVKKIWMLFIEFHSTGIEFCNILSFDR